MIQVCMGQHDRVNRSRIKGKFLILNSSYGISSLVHATVEQDAPHTRAFQRAVSHFLQKHAFQPVDTRDFAIAIRESTGQVLDWFFELNRMAARND